MSEVERMLRSALVPVEPPGALATRLERRLEQQLDAAAEELADWELRTMRDPRNWARPVAAALVLGAAGGGLVLIRARRQQRSRQAAGLHALQRSLVEVAGDVRKRLRR